MYRRVTAINTETPIYALAVTESVGANATGTITFTTTAAAAGTARVYVGDLFVDTAIASGDTVTTIATNVVASINSQTDWAVTATNTAGVVTVTAKQKGLRGNWLRYSAVILGTGVTTTVTPTAQTFFTGGTTADSNTTALATILSRRYYYIVSAAEDSTQVAALVSQVNTQALPINAIRQRVFFGSVDTSGNVTTIATTINAARAEVTWLQNSDWPPSELAANSGALYALAEAPLAFRCNFDGYGNNVNEQATWKVPAPRSGTVPTRATIKAALNNGISPIGVNANGSTYLVSRITTRSLTGATADYRIRDAHKVTVCDRYADDLGSKLALNYSGKLIGNDPVEGARVPGPNVVTPRVLKAGIDQQTRDYGDLDLLQNVDQIIANTIVIRESSPTTRLSARIPLEPVDLDHQNAIAIDQVA